jgi:hypothetical protein
VDIPGASQARPGGGLRGTASCRTLKGAEGLQLWPALKEELINFRRKINMKTTFDPKEHWRESDHDDLVLAAALACWDMAHPGNRALRLVR